MTQTDPRDDQYRAAERQAAVVVERYGQLPGARALTDPATYPEEIKNFNASHMLGLDAALLRPCPCGTVPATWAQPLFVLAHRPNLVSCSRCFDKLRANLGSAISNADPMHPKDCDLCGAPGGWHPGKGLGRLSVAVWRVSAVVVVGTVCAECLK